MDYLRIYTEIIENAKNQNRKKKQGIYYENHHNIPKYVGGNNSKENKVLLTAKEHFICHKLLVEIFPESKGLIFALHRMMFSNPYGNRDYKIGSREFERIRKFIAERNSGVNHHNFGIEMEQITCPHCNKSGGKHGIIQFHFDNCPDNPNNDKELIKKQRKESNYSYNKKQKQITCPYCNKTGGYAAMERHHFENCIDNPKNDKVEILNNRKNNHPLFNKKQELVICPHCGKQGGINSMKAYHFDKCIKNPKNNGECPHCGKIGKGNIMYKFHFDNCPKNLKNEYNNDIRKQKQLICPHCNKEGRGNIMKRYHFDNCKHKKVIV